jgi:type IV secretory pathway VirB10-like protein
LLIHAIVIFFAFPELIKPSAEITPKAISVTLSNPEPQAAFIPPPPPPATKKEKKQKTKLKAPDIMTAKNPEPSSTVAPPPVKSSESKPTPAPNQPVDMMSLVNANRQRRQTEENVASRENAAAVAKERGISQEDARDALIKKNLAQDGTNGIFQIKEIQLHYAQFSFKGWKNNINNARLEIIEVQAGPNENIERAIVKKMIAIIRREYSGDFNWESPHLGRVVILSARLEDNAGLEDFLIREFFGPGAKYGGR